jgi:hypothetical protein
MSKVAITGNASGTGTFTLAAPNSNTDRTLTLPDEAGTVLTNSSTVLASGLNVTGSNVSNMGLELIASATASNGDASVNFTSLDNNYAAWYVYCHSVFPSSNADTFAVRVYDSTGTLKSGGSDYFYRNSITGTDGGATSSQSALENEIRIAHSSSMPNSVNFPYSSQFIIANPSGNGFYKNMFGHGEYTLTSGVRCHIDLAGGYRGDTSPITGLSFFMVGGNIQVAQIYIYGMRTS